MKIILKENQIKRLSEAFKPKTNSYAEFIRYQLKSIYEKIGKYGKLPNPDDNCDTNYGVFDVFPHSEQDRWSILNRFDTNSRVRDEMERIYKQENPDVPFEEHLFKKWVEDNKYDLMGPDGKYTKSLVDINMSVVEEGNANETFAEEILRSKFSGYKIRRFCSGDVRDTKKGIDISLEKDGKSYTVQVKPFSKISGQIDMSGDRYIEVFSSNFNSKKYSPRNVDIFMFVSVSNQNFIMFANNKNKINQMVGKARFFEPPLSKNFEVTFREVGKLSKPHKTSDIFDIDSEKLNDLYFKKEQIEKLIQQQLKKIKRNEKKNAKY